MTTLAIIRRTSIGLAVVLASLGFNPATATTTISGDSTISGVTLDFGPSSPYSDKIRNDGDTGDTTVTLITDSGYLIDYIGGGMNGGVLQVSGGSGFAFVSSSSGVIGSLTIDPQGDVGFTALDFNLSVPNSQVQGSYYYGDITLALLGSTGTVTFQNVLLGSGQNKFAVTADPGIVFSSITFSDVMYEFAGKKKVAAFSVGSSIDSIRQVSGVFTPAPPGAVPEPSTWAMMLLGFGLVGTMIRRKRSIHPILASV